MRMEVFVEFNHRVLGISFIEFVRQTLKLNSNFWTFSIQLFTYSQFALKSNFNRRMQNNNHTKKNIKSGSKLN